jgi:arsenical pump membrane protein
MRRIENVPMPQRVDASRVVSWAHIGDLHLTTSDEQNFKDLHSIAALFEWLASVAVSHGDGSPVRLFTLIYAVGTVVTIFMSNDATAVVLTPPSWPPFASDL